MSEESTGSAARSALTTIQGRITAVAMVTAVTVLFAACVVFTAEQWRSERLNLAENQAQLTALLASPLGRAVQGRDTQKVHRLIQGFAVARPVRDAQFVDTQGRVIESYRREGAAPFAAPTTMQSRTVVMAGNVKLGELLVRRDVPFLGKFLARYLSVAAALLFAAAGLSLFLGRALARRVAEPINRLVRAMHEVSLSGDFSQTVTQTSDDELGRLTQSFNTLLGRLKVNDDELRGAMHELTHARDAAEAANVQKSQFLANMSHEIRTPLNGVLAMAQIMALGELQPEQRERVSVIRKSGEALLEILNDILDVSKIEAGKLELDVIEFDLEQTVRGAVDGFIAVADRKGLALDLDLSAAAMGTRMGDPARLRQIIANLISNALKFTQVGGVSVAVDGTGPRGVDGITVVVRDTGIGMPAEKLPMLFQKFTQLDASTTRQFGGTGLGLSICHELAELMGGDIYAESVVGEGSAFTIHLPLMRVAAAEDFAPDDRGELYEDQGRVLRVLAAEDNPTNQMVLSTIIDIFGADLTLVDNGQKAVEAWRDADYDVILMDIQMPVLDGVGAARAIRAAEAAEGRSRTPIVALSANAMVHQVKEYMAAGMDGHVAKPIELPKLHTALENALAAREAARAAAAA